MNQQTGDVVKFDAAYWMSVIDGSRRGVGATSLRFLLAAASLPYSWFMRLRNSCYRLGLLKQHQAGVPVIVVGNLTVGGTGKTPAVEWVARFLRQQHRQVAILSRGYGSSTSQNDEALVLEANLDDVPHLQDADRVSLAQIAIDELESDILVLDDGYQHRRLKRDLDIVLVDATNPWGWGWCLPRGLLREPRAGLRRAGLIMLTRTDHVDDHTLNRIQSSITKLAPGCPIVHTRHAPLELHNTASTLSLDHLQGRSVLAFCGLGNPAGFWRTLEQLGCILVAQRTFPDHHAYQRADVESLIAWAEGFPDDTLVLTTQKDWVKLQIDQLGHRPLWSLRIALEITQGQAHLENALLQTISVESRDCSLAASPTPVTSLPLNRKDAYDYAASQPV